MNLCRNLKRHSKGFTLIEVLIVVVIIGILASLLIPRMIQQPERARVAEANQFLGVLNRAQVTFMDSTNGGMLDLDQTAGNIGNWQRIGVTNPGVTGLFTYTCVAANSNCVATRNGGALNGATATITIPTGVFACAGGYQTVAAPGSGCVA